MLGVNVIFMGRMALTVATLGMLLHSCFGCAWHHALTRPRHSATGIERFQPRVCGCHAHGHSAHVLRMNSRPPGESGRTGVVGHGASHFVTDVPVCHTACDCAYSYIAKRSTIDAVLGFDAVSAVSSIDVPFPGLPCLSTLRCVWRGNADDDAQGRRARLQIWRI